MKHAQRRGESIKRDEDAFLLFEKPIETVINFLFHKYVHSKNLSVYKVL